MHVTVEKKAIKKSGSLALPTTSDDSKICLKMTLGNVGIPAHKALDSNSIITGSTRTTIN